MLIRNETVGDIPAISRLVTEALLLLPQSTGTEALIVEALRADGALALSLVAEEQGKVIGYLAASAARIDDQKGWALIGPLVVLPSRHRQGIGSALMAEALPRCGRRAGAQPWSAIRPIMAVSASDPSPDWSFPAARPRWFRPCRSTTSSLAES